MNKNKFGLTRASANKAIYFFIFAFFFIFPAFEALGTLSSNKEVYDKVSDEYYITAYDVQMQLEEDNVLKVVEAITVYHDKAMHGIVRYLPTFQTVTFSDEKGREKSLNYKTKISNIKTNAYSYTEETDGNLLIRFGNVGEKVVGTRVYALSYQLQMGDDRINEFDQFYYNVIGTDWDTTISNITFTLKLPSQVEENQKMFLYSGPYGDANEQIITVEEDLKTFNFQYEGTLGAFEGITTRVVLPQGYFKVDNFAYILDYILLGIFAVILIVCIVQSSKHKTNSITPVVMFTPPQNLPPSEMGYIIDGAVDNKDISSLIVYWAQKGFVSIEEEDKKYTLIKEKDISQDSEDYEKEIFNKIFNSDKQVKIDNLGEKIWREVARSKEIIKDKHFSKHFNEKNKKIKNFLIFLSALIVTTVAVRNTILTVEPANRMFVSLLGLLSMVIAYFLIYKQKTHFKTSLNLNKNYLIVFLPILTAIWIGMVLIGHRQSLLSVFVSITAVLTSAVTIFYMYKVQLRKPEGLGLFGEIIGFKQFIVLTEEGRIKMLAEKDPKMFYDVLPYAYVLGVSDDWIRKFENIALAQPSWLVTQGDWTVFDYLIMRSIFNSLMLNTAMQTAFRPQINGGGGGGFGGFGGGGGFTGGGFGGGGGRGW